MEKHVNEGHFSYFAPWSKGLIQEGASLQLNSCKHEPQRGHHPPTGSGKRNRPRETWLMQGHPGVHSLNKSWTSTLPMSGLCLSSSCISSLKDMTMQYTTKDLHCPAHPLREEHGLLSANLSPLEILAFGRQYYISHIFFCCCCFAKIISFIPLWVLNKRISLTK